MAICSIGRSEQIGIDLDVIQPFRKRYCEIEKGQVLAVRPFISLKAHLLTMWLTGNLLIPFTEEIDCVVFSSQPVKDGKGMGH